MSQKNSVCTIYLVRHGESKANVDKTVQGHTNSPLTEIGKEQAREVAEIFKNIEFGSIHTSDLDRARLTAEIIKLNRDIKIETSPLLRERFFGEFEGKDHAEYMEALKDEFDKFNSHLSTEERWDHKAHPSIESDNELLDRFMPYIKKTASNHLGEEILIVAHRYAIRMMLLSLGWGEHENLKAGALMTGGYAILKYDDAGFRIEEVVGEETS